MTRGSEFGVFANCRGRALPRRAARRSRGRSSQRLEEIAKEWGAKGLAYLVYDGASEVRSPIAKFLSEAELEAFRSEPGSTVLFAAGDEATVVARARRPPRPSRARARARVGRGDFTFHWVIDFPLFEWDEETRRWTFLHHPFTRADRTSARGAGRRRSRQRAQPAYDLIVNGSELGGGSIRIHEPGIQARRVRHDGDARRRSSARSSAFLLDALAMGAPPHGGFALGIERFVALMAGEPNIREVIAFPKSQRSGSDPLSGAPSAVPDAQLRRARHPIVVEPVPAVAAPSATLGPVPRPPRAATRRARLCRAPRRRRLRWRSSRSAGPMPAPRR